MFQLSNVLILIFSTRLATSAAVNLPVESSNPLSLTSLYQPNLGHSECYCTDSASWTIPGFVREDCQDATVRMYVTEVVPHDKEKFKFMAQGATSLPGLPLMQTPRTYVSGEYRATGEPF
jgi:hypothetical protein